MAPIQPRLPMIVSFVALVCAAAGCGGDGDKRTVRPNPRADDVRVAEKPRVCFTTASLHLDAGEALAAINQEGQSAISTSLASVARRSFAPNVRRAARLLEQFGSPEAESVAASAKTGLQRVLRDPELLVNDNTAKLRGAFGRARRLAEEHGFSRPGCIY